MQENSGTEIKVILVAIAAIVRKSKSLKEVYETLEDMAAAAGIRIDRFDAKTE